MELITYNVDFQRADDPEDSRSEHGLKLDQVCGRYWHWPWLRDLICDEEFVKFEYVYDTILVRISRA